MNGSIFVIKGDKNTHELFTLSYKTGNSTAGAFDYYELTDKNTVFDLKKRIIQHFPREINRENNYNKKNGNFSRFFSKDIPFATIMRYFEKNYIFVVHENHSFQHLKVNKPRE
jgi:hypothetical protein